MCQKFASKLVYETSLNQPFSFYCLSQAPSPLKIFQKSSHLANIAPKRSSYTYVPIARTKEYLPIVKWCNDEFVSGHVWLLIERTSKGWKTIWVNYRPKMLRCMFLVLIFMKWCFFFTCWSYSMQHPVSVWPWENLSNQCNLIFVLIL